MHACMIVRRESVCIRDVKIACVFVGGVESVCCGRVEEYECTLFIIYVMFYKTKNGSAQASVIV